MPSNKSVNPKRHKVAIASGVSVAAIVVALGLGLRSRHADAVAQWTDAQATPVVSVFKAAVENGSKPVQLPGTLSPWSEAPIYARVSGYLKSWKADIGANVKKGDILGVIDSPDLDQQIAQAKAKMLQASAQARLAQVTADRWQRLIADHSVSQQEADEKIAGATAILASAEAAKAEYSRLVELGNYKLLRAPFDGVVTARRTDIGQLIHADSASGPELFRMIALKKLRLLVPIPQSYAKDVAPGMAVKLAVPEHPGHLYSATLMGTSESIDSRSGTLLAQFKVDNSANELLPGGYADVALPFAPSAGKIVIPASALIFRAQGTQVAVLDKDGKVQLRNVRVALDYGATLQIDRGISTGDQVVDNPPDSLRTGDKVKIAEKVDEHAAKS